MEKNYSLRSKVGSLFGVPVGNTSYRLFLASMNENGKITSRSLLELITVVLEELEELENKE